MISLKASSLVIFSILPVIMPFTVDGQEPSDADAEIWQQLLLEAEENLEWSEDPLGDLVLDSPVSLFWTTSARVGGGYSSNFLKRVNPVSSRFIKLEGDFYLSKDFDQSSLRGLVFFELTGYDREAEADHEAVVFMRAEWARDTLALSYGLAVDAFYGDQIYDAGLNPENAPTGARLRQFRPKATAFTEWILSGKDLLRWDLSVLRADFKEDRYTYWQPGSGMAWTRLWSREWKTVTTLSLYGQFYDEDVARRGNAVPLVPEERLTIMGVQIEEELAWTPRRWSYFRASSRFGLTSEDDREGDYHDSIRWWATLQLRWDLAFIRLQIQGSRQNTRYQERQVAFLDQRPNHQTYTSFKIEAKKPLPWNTALRIRAEWNDFDSRKPEDEFSERRFEALLEWSY